MNEEMSYKNVYTEWCKYLEKIAYVESDEYFDEEEDHELPEGYSLNIKSYVDKKDDETEELLYVCELTKNDEHVFKYRSTYGITLSGDVVIHHRNGHKYMPFQPDMYGISYLELDSGEVYNYIPEGSSHDSDTYCGESFIITDIYYDPHTDLVAYGGGNLSASSCDVMVGDLSEPLNFDPHLASVSRLIDPENYENLNITFERFEVGKLFVTDLDNEDKEYSVDLGLLYNKIKELNV